MATDNSSGPRKAPGANGDDAGQTRPGPGRQERRVSLLTEGAVDAAQPLDLEALGGELADPKACLSGHVLIAMPDMTDPRFERTVIFLCIHSSEGAMGLVINRPAQNITFPQLLSQLGIDSGNMLPKIDIHAGGPVDSSRGFVLHSSDYHNDDSTIEVPGRFGLTNTMDILEALAAGEGPAKAFLALGYAGWGPGQLEAELAANAWLNVPADPALLFDQEIDARYEAAMARLGIDLSLLSRTAGHA